MRGRSSCARLLSSLLISNINREPGDDGNRIAAHDLSQNTRVPRRVPAGADFNDALKMLFWCGRRAYSGAGAERVPTGAKLRRKTLPCQEGRLQNMLQVVYYITPITAQ